MERNLICLRLSSRFCLWSKGYAAMLHRSMLLEAAVQDQWLKLLLLQRFSCDLFSFRPCSCTHLKEEGRAIDGMSLSFNIPCSCCTVHGMESAWKALDRVMALLWSGAGEGAKGRGFSFGFGSVDRMTKEGLYNKEICQLAAHLL
ncbi:hypothetical protein TSUD_198990 [Trifolium subterraneum]|uniref:Uncharacterized protein n=1 Tax=Trifolium subterraneum TaxID=3900 RepID=A0A2Z6MLV9_TRISU|nr:hypothetical protein TSUD_198990 [Trifolium subterraneum]